MKTIISTKNAPKAIGPYSQAVRAGNTLYISGQLPIDPKTGKFAGNDITTQTKQSLNNLKSIIEASQMSLNNVVSVHVFLADMNDFAAMNNIYSTFFTVDFPARVAVQVAKLPNNALVEIEAVAYNE